MTVAENIFGASAASRVRICPDVIMINDGSGHQVVDALRGNFKINENIRARLNIVLDHDIPAGSFESAFIQKKLIDFSKVNHIDFIQSAGIGYEILYHKKVRQGNLFVSCGSQNAVMGAKQAIGFHISEEMMKTLLVDGGLDINVPYTCQVVLEGSFKEGVTAWDFVLNYLSAPYISEFENKIIEFIDLTDNGLTEDEKKVICLCAGRCGAFSAVFSKAAVNGARHINLSLTERMTALPGSIKNGAPYAALPRIKVDACFIGGCACGHIEDLRQAAEILKGRRIHRELRLLIGFASNDDYLQAVKEGLIDIFFDCGAQVTNPGCASCQSTSIGVAGDGEILVTTGCYNYAGCCGTEKSKVYIASAHSVAEAALNGYIGVKKEGL